GLRPRTVVLAVGGIAAALVALVTLASQVSIFRFAPPPKSLDALTDRAREITAALGYTDRPRDAAYGFGFHRSFFDALETKAASEARYEPLRGERPPSFFIWYRQSPHILSTLNA